MDIRQEVPIKSFAVAAYLCKLEAGAGKFLILKRASSYLHETWQMVSGRIEAGETAWQAALREIREETGLAPARFYSTDIVEMFYEVSQNCINLVPVFLGFIEPDQEVELSDEHTDYKWVTAEEASAYLSFDQQRDIVKRIEMLYIQREPFEFLRIEY